MGSVIRGCALATTLLFVRAANAEVNGAHVFDWRAPAVTPAAWLPAMVPVGGIIGVGVEVDPLAWFSVAAGVGFDGGLTLGGSGRLRFVAIRSEGLSMALSLEGGAAVGSRSFYTPTGCREYLHHSCYDSASEVIVFERPVYGLFAAGPELLVARHVQLRVQVGVAEIVDYEERRSELRTGERSASHLRDEDTLFVLTGGVGYRFEF